jgi:hypothetical protein
MQYTLVGNDTGSNITVFDDTFDTPQVARNDHPNFEKIVELAKAGEPIPLGLFDPGVAVAEKFKKLSERVSVAGGTLYFDNEEVHNALAKQVVRFLNEGVDDWEPLVKFFEKVQQNPNNHSRTQLFEWLDRYEFTIDDDGDIIGYKGVRKDNDGKLFSISHGTAIVNGVTHKGAIPNEIDNVVEMPRSKVAHDPATGCSTGLHVGTYEYASDFAQGALLKVSVNPRDVVSVPTHSSWQKVRTCRYRVEDVIDHKISSPLANTWDYEPEEDYDDEEWGDGEGDGWTEPQTNAGTPRFSVPNGFSALTVEEPAKDPHFFEADGVAQAEEQSFADPVGPSIVNNNVWYGTPATNTSDEPMKVDESVLNDIVNPFAPQAPKEEPKNEFGNWWGE